MDYSQLSKDKFDALYNQEVLSLIFLGIKQWSDDHSLLISDIKIYKQTLFSIMNGEVLDQQNSTWMTKLDIKPNSLLDFLLTSVVRCPSGSYKPK